MQGHLFHCPSLCVGGKKKRLQTAHKTRNCAAENTGVIIYVRVANWHRNRPMANRVAKLFFSPHILTRQCKSHWPQMFLRPERKKGSRWRDARIQIAFLFAWEKIHCRDGGRKGYREFFFLICVFDLKSPFSCFVPPFFRDVGKRLSCPSRMGEKRCTKKKSARAWRHARANGRRY